MVDVKRYGLTAVYIILGIGILGLVAVNVADLKSIITIASTPIIILLAGWYIGRPIVTGLLYHNHDPEWSTDMDREYTDQLYWPSVSVQMPAYNESENIREVVESVATQYYPGDLEIIVVDDGSTDETWDILQVLSEKYNDLDIYTKENEGVGPARNLALEKGTNDIVVSMDSDTMLQEDSLLALIGPFSDSDTVAVASNCEVLNANESWWTKSQAIEYLVSMEMARMFQSKFRHLLVVSGGCGAYRRSVLEDIGGWSMSGGNFYAEDFELTIRATEHGIVRFAPNAIALTVAPTTLRGWWDQRMKWAARGLRVVLHHRRAMFNPDYSLLGLFALPLKLGLSIYLMWMVISFISSLTSYENVINAISEIGSTSLIAISSAAGLALLLLGIISTYVIYTEPLKRFSSLPAYLILYRHLHILVRFVAFSYVILTYVMLAVSYPWTRGDVSTFDFRW